MQSLGGRRIEQVLDVTWGVLLGMLLGPAVVHGSLWWVAVLPVLAIGLVLRGTGRRADLARPVALIAVLAVSMIWSRTPADVGNTLLVAVGLEALVQGVRVLRRRRHASLVLAVVESERAALAGDIHDTVGHRLTLDTLRLGRLSLDPALTPDQRALVNSVRDDLADLAEQVGDTVTLLGTGAAPEPEHDPDRVLDRARAAGMDVSADLDALDAANPLCRATVARVLSEGLANAARHAPGRPVRVHVRRVGGEVELVVQNPLGRSVPGTGTGLPRASARLTMLGGRLDHGVTDGTFRLAVRLPLEAHPVRVPR